MLVPSLVCVREGVNGQVALGPGRACSPRLSSPTVHIVRIRCSQVHRCALALSLAEWVGWRSSGVHRVRRTSSGQGSLLHWGANQLAPAGPMREGGREGGLQRSGVDRPLCSSRARLPKAFIAYEGGREGGSAQGLGIRLFAFGSAYWPLATAHSDPLWVRTCFGCVNGAPG